MKERLLFKFVLILMVSIQLWFLYVSTQYPVIGAGVKLNQAGSWYVSTINERNSAMKAGLQIGDVIVQVNGRDPIEYSSVFKWHSLDQADHVLASRNGSEFQVSFKGGRNFTDYDALAVTLAALSLIGSLLLLKKSETLPLPGI